jgi:pimeloyl-ACP methyl ester carboxylesterase
LTGSVPDVGLAGATFWRAQARAARATRAHPPEGRLITLPGGRRLHAVVRGQGPDLVLIHGASGSSRDMTFALVDRLAPAFRVIAVDRPGLGHSDPLPHGDASLVGQVAAIRAACASLGATNPLLVGQSYGDSVALAWALEHPAAALVTLSAPSLPWPGSLDPWYRLTARPVGRALLAAARVPEAYVRRLTDHVFAPGHAPPGYLAHLGTDLTLRRSQLLANTAQINALRPQLVAMEPHYPGLSLPTEMVHGTADSTVPLTIHSGPLALRLATATLTVIDGAGHMPHHSHPEVVLDAIHRAAARAGLR